MSSFRAAQRIDKKIAESLKSVCCDAPCKFAFTERDMSYRAFAVCTRCGNREEF